MNEYDKSGRRTYFGDVLVLLHIDDQSQTCAAYTWYDIVVLFLQPFTTSYTRSQFYLYRIHRQN